MIIISYYPGHCLIEGTGIDEETRIFSVSSRWGFETKVSGDTDLRKSSDLEEISDHLIAFSSNEKNELLKQAIVLKTGDLMSEVLLRLRLEQKVLEMPIEELEEKQQLFKQKISEIENSRQITHDTFVGYKKRCLA